MRTGPEEGNQSPFIYLERELHIGAWLQQVLLLFPRHGVFVSVLFPRHGIVSAAETEFAASQDCLDTSNVTTSLAVTKFRLEPTEIHWTSPCFYMSFMLFTAVCQPRAYSGFASEIFLHSLESNLLP